jgi:hypothetical protein
MRSSHRRTLLYIAHGWIAVGSLMCLFVGSMAIGHYVFGMPVHDDKTGQLSTTLNILKTFLIIGGGGAWFATMGILLRRVVRKWDNDS